MTVRSIRFPMLHSSLCLVVLAMCLAAAQCTANNSDLKTVGNSVRSKDGSGGGAAGGLPSGNSGISNIFLLLPYFACRQNGDCREKVTGTGLNTHPDGSSTNTQTSQALDANPDVPAQTTPVTTTTTKDNTPAGNTLPGTTNTDGTQTEHNNAQVLERTTPSQTSVLPDTTKKANPTEKSPTQPISPQTPQSTTAGSGLNTRQPKIPSTGQTSANPLQPDQHHATPTLQTSHTGKGHSPDKNVPKERVVTPAVGQPKQQTPKDTPSEREQPQEPDTSKNEEPFSGTTTSDTGAPAVGKNQIPPTKPATTSTAAADHAATHKAVTTTGDKEVNPEQASVSSPSEPAKGDTTVQTTPLPNVAKALEHLNNTDISITNPWLTSFAPITIFLVMSL